MVRILPTRFSIRSIQLLAAIVAGFLAWRLHNPESQIAAAINEAGGKAIYGYQFEFIFEGSKRNRSRPSIVTNLKSMPPRTLSEIVFGDAASRCVNAVELPLERITPVLITKLESLRHLNYLLVSYPDITSKRIEENNTTRIEIVYPDPKHGETRAELDRRFGNRLLW